MKRVLLYLNRLHPFVKFTLIFYGCQCASFYVFYRTSVYNLTGVLIHIGDDAHQGHYKAHIQVLKHLNTKYLLIVFNGNISVDCFYIKTCYMEHSRPVPLVFIYAIVPRKKTKQKTKTYGFRIVKIIAIAKAKARPFENRTI